MLDKQDSHANSDAFAEKNEESRDIEAQQNNQINADSDPHFYTTPERRVEIKPYDPATQHKVIRDRLHAMEIINERFARQFRIGLFDLLRRQIDVIAHPIEIKPYHQFAAEVPTTICLNLIHFSPLRGTSLFLFSSELIYIVVDNLFGGNGKITGSLENREFTHTEHRIIHRLRRLALDAYQEVWKDIFVLKLEYSRTEMQLKFTNIVTSPNDIVLNSSFTIEIGEFSGKFTICIPYTMIEPLRELLLNPPIECSNQDENVWRSSITSGIKKSQIELVVNFTEICTKVSNVLSLQIGDVLPIEKPDVIDAKVGGVPVLLGRYGKLGKHYALQVEQIMNTELDPLKEEIIHE